MTFHYKVNLDREEDDFPLKITMKVDAHFYLCGYVNKQGCCNFNRGRVTGSYFLEEVVGNTVTVTSEHYRIVPVGRSNRKHSTSTSGNI